MALQSVKEGSLELKVGESSVVLRYRRPTAEEMLQSLAMKVPGPDSQNPALELLRGNLELGAACLLGVNPGDLIVDEGQGQRAISSDPNSPEYRADWKEEVRRFFPTLLVALGQHLSQIPAASQERKKK
jgi:hypothetical protein